MFKTMKITWVDIALALEVLLAAIILAVYGYFLFNTHDTPKFFPTELKGVRSDFGLVLVQPTGAPNPHPTPRSYASDEKNANSTN